jgi:D-3-phosphoglycerate dehydrogenase / 2-oxoglutarate reductase
MTAAASVVLVTPRSFARGDEELRRELTSSVERVEWQQQGGLEAAELRRLVADVDGWIAGVEGIDRSVIESAPRLRVIARYGVGVDNVDLEAAAESGVVVTNTPGANAGAVAELVLGLLVALARGIVAADREVRAGRWLPSGGVALEGKTLGLLGFGAVGRAVARRVGVLGCRIIAHDPADAASSAASELGVELLALQDVVSSSDFLSLHLPVLPETHGIVDARFLSAMKPGAYLVNAARGELIDEAALVAALRSGHLAGAALDTLSQEPPPPDFPLGQLDNVVLTPHLGAHTDLAVCTMGRRAVENCLAVLRGEPPPDPVALEQRSR